VLDDLRSAPLPIRPCLDVGHRNLGSRNPDDADPYAWIREFGSETAVIHIHQTDDAGSRHWPFSKEHNSRGIVRGRKLLEAVSKYCGDEVMLALEVTGKAFFPDESEYLSRLRESIAYWKGCLQVKRRLTAPRQRA